MNSTIHLPMNPESHSEPSTHHNHSIHSYDIVHSTHDMDTENIDAAQYPIETREHTIINDQSSNTSALPPSQPSSPSLSHNYLSPPPPAFRVHNPHTLPSSDQSYISPETILRNDGILNEKWDPTPPPPSEESMSFSPFHLDRINNEKSTILPGHSPSPHFHPAVQSSVAPTSTSYHNTFASPAPVMEDLEMQSQSRVPNHGGAASDLNTQPSPTLACATRSVQRGERASDVRKKRKNNNGDNRRKTSDSTVTGTFESGRRSRSPTSSTSSHYRSGSRLAKPITATSRDHVRNTPSYGPHAHAHAPPPASQKPFSLFRRTLASFDISGKDQRRADGRGGHNVSWAHHDNHESSKYRLSTRVPYSSNGYSRDGKGQRKTGIPGRNGEEPETDLFNFVNIMVNMPNNPKMNQVFIKLLKILAIMTTSYFLLMALYFASEYQSTDHLHNISILVVDLDHSMIGSQFLNFTQQDNMVPGQVNWSIQSKYKDVPSVISDVENGNYWGAMVVMPNASWMLNKALSTPLPNYDPTGAFTFIYDGGRDPLTVKPYVVASMYTQFLQFSSFFNPAWISFVLKYADNNNTTLTPLTDAPQVLGTPVAFTELDIHPTTATIITSATSVAYIWIFLIAGGSTYLVAHVIQPIARISSVRRTMMLLLVPLLAFLSSLSMTYTVLLRIFGVPFDSTGQFIFLFLGMLLLQAAVASLVLFLIFLIPVTFIPMITITFVVMNVIAVFKPVELMPGFYRWIYAMPFLNAVQMARYVLMGSYNRLSYNVPILFAWIVVPITLLPFAITRQKRLMAEVMEMEELERRHGALSYDGDKALKRERRSKEVDRRHRSRSRYHHNEDLSDDNQYSSSECEDSESEFNSHHHSQRRNRHGRRRVEDDYDVDDNIEKDDGYHDRDHLTAANTARLIRPLNPRTISSGVMPSAPPESQVFDTLNRPFVEMPKLSRHPYASELTRPRTPDEIK